MNIGEAAKASGVTAKMIRYYESVGLISPAGRTANNYRVYTQEDIHTLCFIKRARALGFSMEETATLLALWQDQSRASADVRAIASKHLQALEYKIAQMQEMADTLKHLVVNCAGDNRPSCPILSELASTKGQ